ncbi:MAG: hypothetical protein VKK07_02850 [Merismopediaceae bacterium]|nr:hypothetical protein [Merismopediaceae bacterium]
MELKSLAQTFAVLTILEPTSKICQLTAKLATAGTTTEENDSDVIKEIKASLPELEKELKGLKETKLKSMEKLLTKILTPDN